MRQEGEECKETVSGLCKLPVSAHPHPGSAETLEARMGDVHMYQVRQ